MARGATLRLAIIAILAAVIGISSAWAVEPTEGLISHWEFDDGEGDIAYDSIGDNNGIIYGANWTNGYIGGALSFDGIDDYVDVPDDSSISLLPNGSISAWFKSYNSFSSSTALLSKDPVGNNNEGDAAIVFRDNQKVELWVLNDSDREVRSDTSILPDLWYHIVTTWDGSKKKLYIRPT